MGTPQLVIDCVLVPGWIKWTRDVLLSNCNDGGNWEEYPWQEILMIALRDLFSTEYEWEMKMKTKKKKLSMRFKNFRRFFFYERNKHEHWQKRGRRHKDRQNTDTDTNSDTNTERKKLLLVPATSSKKTGGLVGRRVFRSERCVKCPAIDPWATTISAPVKKWEQLSW